MKQYICRAWRVGDETCSLSRVQEGETLEGFKKRMSDVFPFSEGWHAEYSEWNRIDSRTVLRTYKK